MATAAQLIQYAEAQQGKKYVFGTEGPNTFDCSGLMQYVFKHFGINLPRTTGEQVTVGTAVNKKSLQPGDLVFSSWDGKPHSHVGMYIGSGKIIVAPHTGDVVKIESLNANYLAHVDAARRVPGVNGSGGVGSILEGGALGAIPVGVGKATDSLAGAANRVADAVGGLVAGVNDVGKLAETLGKLALPTTMVRVVAGGLGLGFLMVGIGFLLREVKG